MAGIDRRTLLLGASANAALVGLAGRVSAHSTAAGRRIKIGQIGVGHAHAGKLSVFRESPDYEVVGVVEPDAALREAAATQAPFRDLAWMTQEQLLNVAGL